MKNQIKFISSSLLSATLLCCLGSAAADQPAKVGLAGSVDTTLPVEKALDPKSDAKDAKIDPFSGKGAIDTTQVTGPKTLIYSIKPGLSKAEDGTQKITNQVEVDYGVDLYGRTVELHCISNWTREATLNDDGSRNRQSGFESATCGAKTQVYNNEEKGLSASVAVDVQSPIVIGHALADRDPNFHVIIPFNVMKTLADGKAAVVGTITSDHTFGGGTEITYGGGAGMRLSSTNAVESNMTRSTYGTVTNDVVCSHQAEGDNKLYYVRVWRQRSGDPPSSGKGVEVGIEITREPNQGATPILFKK